MKSTITLYGGLVFRLNIYVINKIKLLIVGFVESFSIYAFNY